MVHKEHKNAMYLFVVDKVHEEHENAMCLVHQICAGGEPTREERVSDEVAQFVAPPRRVGRPSQSTARPMRQGHTG